MKFNKYIIVGAGLILAIVISTVVYFRSIPGVFHRQYFGKWQYQGVNRVSGLTASLVYSSDKIRVNVASGKKNTVDFSTAFPKAIMSVEKNRIIYSTENGNKKIIYSLNDRGVKEEIVLENSKNIEKEYVYEINSPGLIPKQNSEGDWFFYTETDKNLTNPVFKIPKPFMIDTTGKKSDLIETKLESKNGKQIFKLMPDINWLTSKQRKYPVTIDPTIENPDNPVAYWKFDEGQGTATTDSSQSKVSGTLSGATKPTWQTEDMCISGKCLYYNGSTAYVSTADINYLDGATNFTVSTWVKFNTLADWATIMSKYGDTSHNITIQLSASGYQGNNDINVALMNGTMDVQGATNGNIIEINKWYHIEVVYDGSQLTNETKLKIFVNGVERSMSFYGTIPSTTASNSSVVNIGQENNAAYINGFIDELKIYNYTRTTDEVKADFNSVGSVKGVAAAFGQNNQSYLSKGLVGYWKMEESSWGTPNCTDSVVLDSSGNSNGGKACPASTGPIGNAVGRFGGGGGFDGNNDYINVANNSSYKPTTALTYSAWVYHPSDSTKTSFNVINGAVSGSAYGGHRLFASGSSSTTMFTSFTVYGATGDHLCQVQTSATYLPKGSWSHLVGTYNGSKINVFINGSLVGECSYDYDTISQDSNPLFIGATNPSTGFTYGTFDEVRIYNRALSPSEVSQLYSWAPGPVGYWRFDEGYGDTVNDSSGNGGIGTWQGTQGNLWSTGKYGKAGLFNTSGNNDNLVYVSGNALDDLPNGDFTYSYWINYDPTLNGGMFPNLGGKMSCSTGWEMYSSDGFNNIQLAVTLPTTSAVYRSASNVFQSYKWTHVTAVWHASSKTANLYINGQEVNYDVTTPGQGTYVSDVGNDFGIGGHGCNSGNHWVGMMDDVRVYDYARNQKQIVEDMNAGHPAPGSPVGSALGWWKFDEGMGTVVNDSGTGNNNGVFDRVSWANDGKYNKAGLFTGNNGPYVLLSANDKYDTLTEGTITAWVKLNVNAASGLNQVFVADSGNCVNPFEFAINKTAANTAQLEIWADSSGCSAEFNGYVSIPNPYSWHHIAYSSNSSGNSFYLDGVKKTATYAVGSSSSSFFLNNSSANTTQYSIGSVIDGSIESFNGIIDEVRIFASALTDDQIKMEYNRGQSSVMGVLSNTSGLTGGVVASDSASAQYCVPGDTAICNPPVAEWNFEEGKGISSRDSSGNERTATLNNNLTWGSGYIGKALNFSTENGALDVPNGIFNNTSAFTMVAWIYPTSITEDMSLYCNDTYAYKCWYIGGANDHLRYCSDGSCSNEVYTYNNSIVANRWQHVAITYSGSPAPASGYRLYINSIDRTEDGVGTAITTDLDDIIGAETITSPNSEFRGKIDRFQIYNYARTPAQIAWDFNQGKPIGYWKMDECSGNVLHDSSLTRNDGTWYGSSGGSQMSTGNCTTPASTAWYNGRNGKLNYSLNFDGTDDYVVVNAPPNIDTLTDSRGTITIWAKPSWGSSTTTTSRSFWGDYDMGGSVDAFALSFCGNDANCALSGLGSPGDLMVTSADGGATQSKLRIPNTNYAWSADEWVHIAAVWDDTIATNDIKIYVNGVEKTGTKVNEGGLDLSALDLTTSLYIGDTAANILPYSGSIDEFKVYNYPMTSAQIRNDFNQGSAVRFGPITGAP